MKTWQRIKFVPLFAVSLLAACAKDLPESKEIPIPIVSALSILETEPANGATDVPLDTTITITFDQKIDAYSAIPQNFEIWTDDGTRVGVEKLVSTRFIKHPHYPDFYVSQVTVSLNGTYLLPNMKYYFMWGESQATDSDIDPNALGIQSLFGARLPQGGISFTTGTEYSSINKSALEVLAVSPGRSLTRGKVFEFDAEFGDLFSRSSENSYVTVNKRAAIQMQFSEPFVDRGSEYDLIQNGLRELAPTSVDEFGNMIIFTVSKDIKFNELYNSVRELDWEDWIGFRDSIQNRLRGTVRSTNGRKTLIFELDDDCSEPQLCQYPEWPGSVVVVVLKDLKSWQSNKVFLDNIHISGFIHFPGFTMANPISFDFGKLTNQEAGL